MAGLQLLALVACALVGLTTGHFADPRVSTFSILPTAPLTTRKVTTAVKSGGTADCTFTFETSPASEKAKPAAAAPKPAAGVNFQYVMDMLKGTCVTKRPDFWEYEMCIGESVKQRAGGDVYNLGARATVEGLTQVYPDGATCEAIPSRAPRRVVVTWACNKNAETPVIVRVQETSTCVYAITATSSALCGDMRFEDLTNAAVVESEAPTDVTTEDFFLEIAQLHDGRVACSVNSNEPRASGSKLNFRSFELKVERSGGASPLIADMAEGERFIARHPGRVALGPNEATLESSGKSIALRSTGSFDGKLAHLKLLA